MTHDKHAAAARAGGLNAGVVAAKVPTYKHVARGPTEADRVLALVASGSIDPTTMWRKTGTVAISGWQALSAHRRKGKEGAGSQGPGQGGGGPRHPHQKPVLREEVGARALRVRSVSREKEWASAGVQDAWVSELVWV